MSENHYVVCAALPNEVSALCKMLRIPVPTPRCPVVSKPVRDGVRLTVLVSGVGKERMKQRLKETGFDTVDCWISFGFAGGLSPELRTNEYAAGYRLMDGASRELLPVQPPGFLPADSQRMLLCADELVDSVGKKQALFAQTGAALVDMESAAVAKNANDRNEPFFWLRGITDSSQDSLPVQLLSCLNTMGYPSTLRAVAKILLFPPLLPAAIRLGYRSAQVSRTLAEQFHEMLHIRF